MRRNRLKLITPDGLALQQGIKLTAPGVYRRVLGVSLTWSAITSGDFGHVDFTINGVPACRTVSGTAGDIALDMAFVLGGQVASGLMPTGPLPDTWWGPDLPVKLVANGLQGGTIQFAYVLLEECDLSEG